MPVYTKYLLILETAGGVIKIIEAPSVQYNEEKEIYSMADIFLQFHKNKLQVIYTYNIYVQ